MPRLPTPTATLSPGLMLASSPLTSSAARAAQQVKVAVNDAGQGQPPTGVDHLGLRADPLVGVGIAAYPDDAIFVNCQRLGPWVMADLGVEACVAEDD
jgi:hypothetical protein